MIFSTEQLDVFFGSKQILEQVDFSARVGEITSIIGPNGSGKTTLLRSLCGDVAYKGNISVNGANISRLNARELALTRAVLSQFSTISFPFTVREVVKLGILQNSDAYQNINLNLLPDQALEEVGLSGFSGRLYQELSGGEQQRVQLARVLCQVWRPIINESPRWLLLDEPVSSLDIQHQLRIMQVASNYAQNGGGVIAVLHDINLTTMYSDEIFVLKNGQMISSGEPASVLSDQILQDVFECGLHLNSTPEDGTPFVLPQSIRV